MAGWVRGLEGGRRGAGGGRAGCHGGFQASPLAVPAPGPSRAELRGTLDLHSTRRPKAARITAPTTPAGGRGAGLAAAGQGLAQPRQTPRAGKWGVRDHGGARWRPDCIVILMLPPGMRCASRAPTAVRRLHMLLCSLPVCSVPLRPAPRRMGSSPSPHRRCNPSPPSTVRRDKTAERLRQRPGPTTLRAVRRSGGRRRRCPSCDPSLPLPGPKLTQDQPRQVIPRPAQIARIPRPCPSRRENVAPRRTRHDARLVAA